MPSRTSFLSRHAATLAWLAVALVAVVTLGDRNDGLAEPLDVTTIRVDGVALTAEIADTLAARQRGLMHRQRLPANHGMLFIYERPQPLKFWMKNTYIELDIGFFDADGVLLNIERMQPLDTSVRYQSAGDALYALEVNPDWFARNGIGPGARLRLPQDAP